MTREPEPKSLYAGERNVTDLDDCHFYHTMEIPGYPLIES